MPPAAGTVHVAADNISDVVKKRRQTRGERREDNRTNAPNPMQRRTGAKESNALRLSHFWYRPSSQVSLRGAISPPIPEQSVPRFRRPRQRRLSGGASALVQTSGR